MGTIIARSKHDEFVSLFQRQLNQRKQSQMEQHQRKQSHVKSLEKRKSVPDFAMLSAINSEDDLKAHTQRLATLREDRLSNAQKPTKKEERTESKEVKNETKFRQKLLLNEAGNEINISDEIALKIGEWDENMATRHG